MAIDKRLTVCVVGSGPGGAVVAVELAKHERIEITLVDIDDASVEYTQAGARQLHTLCSGHPFNQDHTRAFGFGGSSNLWHGVLTTLDDGDWADFEALVGGPIAQDVKAYYGRLEDYFRGLSAALGAPAKALARIGALHAELFSTGIFAQKDFYIQKSPLRTRQLIRGAARRYRNLKLAERTVALALRPDSRQPSLAKELVVSREGKVEVIRADVFVIAAGSLESPRLLLQSIDGGFRAVENANIGRYLMDHPWLVLGELRSKKGPFRLSLFDAFVKGGFRYRIGLLPRLKPGSERLAFQNHCLSLKPMFLGMYKDFRDALKSLVSSQLTFPNLLGLIWRYRPHNVLACALLLASEKFGFGIFVKRALVFCYLEQKPDPGSRVTLSGSTDQYGRSVPDVKWVVTASDYEQASEINRFCRTAMAPSQRFEYIPYEVTAQSLASSSHHAGTMRMAADPATGVVNRDLKMFGSENVYVCDLSIFPKYGNSNPTLTLCAFARRLADHLAKTR